MRRLQLKFPNQIRISGWDFGSSARAMNQAGGKDSLMTYEEVSFTQAEGAKYVPLTFERKIMSTKTSIKRIALVAVSALGVGLLSVVPANAATDVWDIVVAETIAANGETATQVAGPANFVGLDNSNVTAAAANTNWTVEVSGAGASILSAGTDLTIATNKLTASTAVNTAVNAANDDFKVNTPTAGTVSIKVYKNVLDPATGIVTTTLEETMTVTVKSAATANVYSATESTVFGTTVTNAAATSVTEAALAATPAKGDYVYDGTTEVFRVTTDQEDGNGANLTSGFKTTVATITGAGTLGLAANTPIATVVAEAAQSSNIYVFADGRAGKATLTISVSGAVVKTYSITFYGDAASFKVASTTHSVLGAGVVAKYLGIGDQQWWQLSTIDKDGNVVSTTPDVVVTIADDTILSDQTAANPNTGLVKVQGEKAGTTTFTVKDAATGLIVLGPVTVNVSDVEAAAATLTLDESEYTAGKAFTLSITAKDANGLPFADGIYNNMAGLATSTLVYKSDGGQVSGQVDATFIGGVATIKGFMPQVSGEVKFTLTLKTAGVATAAQGAVLTASANVVNVSDAATDAATEATEAANAATDAANAAAEAADAATAAAQDAQAAVADLAAQVATLIAGIKAQITRLTNLVIKIQKKVKA